MIIDDESEPGAWARELAALGTHGPKQLGRHRYEHLACGWSGDEPSVSDSSELVRQGDRWVMDRTHLLICPRCFAVMDVPKKEED